MDWELTEEEKRRIRMKQQRRRKRRQKVMIARAIFAFVVVFLITLVIFGVRGIVRLATKGKGQETFFQAEEPPASVQKKKVNTPPAYQVDLLTVNEYSRVGDDLPEVKNVFVHYTANKGTSAAQNKSYFENLKDTHETSASAHFIIGYEGEIVQCIPTAEVAYAVAGRNYDSLSIECCYLEENGKFTESTYQTLVHLCAFLVSKFDLEPADIMRHYDDNGKNCPKYYAENEGEWLRFIQDVESYIETYGTIEQPEAEEPADEA